MRSAGCDGRLDVMQWLHDNNTEGCTAYALDDAASSVRLDVVQCGRGAVVAHQQDGCCTIGAMAVLPVMVI